MPKIKHTIKLTISDLDFLNEDISHAIARRGKDRYDIGVDRWLDFHEKMENIPGIRHHEMTHRPSQTHNEMCVWVVYIDMPHVGDIEHVLSGIEEAVDIAYREVISA